MAYPFRVFAALLALASPLWMAEKPDRAAVAVAAPTGTFVSWRLLPTDPPNIAFDLLGSEDAKLVRLNSSPILTTNFLDSRGRESTRYYIRPIIAGRVGRPLPVKVRADGKRLPYLSIPLRRLPGYTANDGSVGDLDGDGELDLVVHRIGRSHDNSQSGETDPPILEAYRLDGRFLWRIDLGRNVREGAHYTQFLVYDFDGDGRAEVACKTADGTTDGRGGKIGDPAADHRNAAGYVLKGPEFLTVFDGRTGRALSTVSYVPARHPMKTNPTSDELKEVWGDGYGNRVDRFLAAVAYLDGTHPSLVFSRGYYTRTVLAAWDFRGGKLRKRWVFDSGDGEPATAVYSGQGNHNLSVADVDGDSRDEIVYGSCTIDDNGRGLYSTGLGHGDALHVSDLDPDRPGLEVFAIHEHSQTRTGVTFRDARTGEILWQKRSPDVGRGVAFDIDPRYPGAECWASMSEAPLALWSAKGEQIAAARPKACNFAVWWDGDPLRELLDGTTVSKWNWERSQEESLMNAEGCESNNGTKATPVLCADILGDWREEVVWRSSDGKELRIYTTPIPTNYRLPALLSDRQYRLAVAWQNVGYNQPPHPSFEMARRLAEFNRGPAK
jgi:rhamnogalacturonan endolyase